MAAVNCGEVIEPGAKFCVKCGTRIDDEEQKSAETGGSGASEIGDSCSAGAGDSGSSEIGDSCSARAGDFGSSKIGDSCSAGAGDFAEKEEGSAGIGGSAGAEAEEISN